MDDCTEASICFKAIDICEIEYMAYFKLGVYVDIIKNFVLIF